MDNIIQKSEIDEYKKYNSVNCIFNNYLNTIHEDISIEKFINNYNTSTTFTKNEFKKEPPPPPANISFDCNENLNGGLG